MRQILAKILTLVNVFGILDVPKVKPLKKDEICVKAEAPQ